ncbi:EbsA family protein [Apilactobacillus xinyiensis]|uniref:EbsA family protein n=1 Tax=Apilactobacillus xinyiensis TaxID=2841032 RepID=UPI001C7CF607|nr:EbsA family protein [Apilactobacillus xinyiensis]
MIPQKRSFLYQPDMLNSIIYWSWVVALFFIGLTFWLEVTHFQWITLMFFIAFAFFTWCGIFFRKISINDQSIVVSTILNPQGSQININEISNVKSSKRKISFVFNNKKHEYLLPSNSIIEILSLIK